MENIAHTDLVMVRPYQKSRNTRLLMVILGFITFSLTGFAVAASDPIQQIMRKAGAYSDLPKKEQDLALASVLELGMSLSALLGVFAATMLKWFGHAGTSILGITAHCLGYILIVYTSGKFIHLIAALSFGLAFQALISSHISLGDYFPDQKVKMLTVISSAADLSLLVPVILSTLSTTLSVQKNILIYVAICTVYGYSASYIIFQNFSQNTKKDGSDISEKKALIAENEITHDSTIYENSSHLKQMLTPEFAILLFIFTFSFVRKKSVAIYIRHFLQQTEGLDTDYYTNLYTSYYNYLVPYSFILNPVWAYVNLRYSVLFSGILMNGLSFAYLGLLLIPNIHVQMLSVLMFIAAQCYCYLYLVSTLSYFFGMSSVPGLQGYAGAITGLISLAFDAKLTSKILGEEIKYRNLVIFYLIITVLLIASQFSLYWFDNKRKNKIAKQMYISNTHTLVQPRV